MRSIRSGLLLALLGALCVALAGGGVLTFRAARSEAGTLFDYHLEQIALSLRDQRFHGSAEALAADESLDYVIRIWDQDGLTVFFSRPHDDLPELTRLGYSTTESAEGAWRLYATQYHGQTIAVAQPMRVRDRLAARAAWRILQPFFFLLPVMGLLIWVMVGRGLRPLGRLAATVQARTPDGLDPVPVTGAPEEARPLIEALNDLLVRLRSAHDAQRAFVADAAHELRTPLTALHVQAQLVERAASEEERSAALSELKSGLQRAARTVQQMLTLARLEPGQGAAERVPVALDGLIRDAVAGRAALAAARDIDLGVAESDARVVVRGDADALAVLLDNLVGNALNHVPAGGRVDVSCGLRDGMPCLEVADNGPGIPADERERVFDRFYRRSGSTGAGLGLSIVRAIAERHGARVVLSESAEGGVLVRVIFFD